MPFCDLLNMFVSFFQAAISFLYSFTNLPAPNYPDAIGSVFGCNIV